MSRQSWLILAAIVLLTALPLWLVPRPAAGPDGKPGEIFGGSDNKAQQAISQIAPDYKPWFAPVIEPASAEIASLLFALQAALGAGAIGYWLGASVMRDKMRKQADREKAEAATARESEFRAD
jgi:cobalt/nickel transport protein